jgi:hypothetical protein
MGPSPGCWKVFGEILNKEFSDPNFMKVHRLTVDAYAGQHVGGDDPRARQSINIHLVALYLALEAKLEFSKIPPIMDRLIKSNKGRFPKLNPPDFSHTLKVTDVAKANDAKEHQRLVAEWAEEVWRAWVSEHGRIRELVGGEK